ncbi:hypothetical protein KDA14_00795 [Candidatus Saccharibacteria bacterium]|nr:hypothetical protein [Candidatus Saccharibacteria bacterium]
MAEDKSKESKDAKDTKDTKQVRTKEQGTTWSSEGTKRALLAAHAVVGFIFLLSLAFAAGHRSAYKDYTYRTRGDVSDMRPMLRDLSMPHQGYGNPYNDSSSNTGVQGVVTAVDGDTITVAGNGTTTKVSVSSNTNYVGDDKPAKINDSIVAFGAKNSDDVLVASSVRLSRQ